MRNVNECPSELNANEFDELLRIVFKRDLQLCQGCSGTVANYILRIEDSRLGPGIPWDWVSVCDACQKRYQFSTPSVDFLDPNLRIEFNKYYKSEQWRRLRHRIWERDGFLCQSCLLAKADQVHHLNYDHFQAEFDFELKAICTKCHCREHRVAEQTSKPTMRSSDQLTLKLDFGDDAMAVSVLSESVEVEAQFCETVNEACASDFVDQRLSPISEFRTAFWNKVSRENQFGSKKLNDRFDCRCRKKKVVFTQSTDKAKRKKFHWQCMKCGELSSAKAGDASPDEAILEAVMGLKDKMSQKVADDHSAKRRGKSWVEAVAQGVFWPCDCKNLRFCVREFPVGLPIHGYQCMNCGGWMPANDSRKETSNLQVSKFDSSIVVQYRSSGFHVDGAALVKAGHAKLEAQFDAEMERNRLSLQKKQEDWYVRIQLNYDKTERSKPECKKLALLVWKKYVGVCQRCLSASAADIRLINYYPPAPLHSYNLIPLCNECICDFDKRTVERMSPQSIG